ncbi:type VI secretion system protein TssA [Brucella gallinifaecis]|uniref:Type VI secretion system protein TssA n=1 Tax=Brucella gallinifaecis TaxID=215590 RepID=A0A502BLQ2_9HYPH|nr:type VI secretion system protein TssA [Brucella gallinifaecis]TPF74013.1 type VI secretion system protein TssA [Brucella gallinifaecis]
MAIDILLTPIDADNPCGDNLEYDADFLRLEQVAASKPEQQFGSTIIPEQTPDWAQVERLASALLQRTKDLRVMLHLARAWTQLRGLQGYADGLTLVCQAMMQYWDSLQPPLTFDGATDPQLRINALAELGDNAALAVSARIAPLLKSAGDEISVRDASALLDGSKSECAGFPGGRGRLQDEWSRSERPERELVRRIAETLTSIRMKVIFHLGESALPEMSMMTNVFSLLAQYSQHATSASGNEETEPLEVVASTTLNWRNAQIESRDDAQLMLDRVKNYFCLHEPSHPAPLMIERVQRLIALDFMQIIHELAPDGLNQLKIILGSTQTEEDN